MRTLSQRMCIKLLRIPPPRGLITDRKGRILATNRKAFRVLLLERKASNSSLLKLSQILGMSMEELGEVIRKDTMLDIVELKKEIPFGTLLKLEEEKPFLPYVIVQEINRRYYPNGDVGAHLIGYVGEISKKELERWEGYEMGDLVGKMGVEKAREEELKGVKGGQRIEVDVRGQIRRLLDRLEPKAGREVRLTIDIEIQRAADEALKGKRGAVVVMNPQTGEVLALASSPSFDPNLFITPDKASRRQVNALLTDRKFPLLNRAISGTYPPGSIFKLITAVAALESGKANKGTRFYCPGGLQVGRRFFRCWRRHDSVDFLSAIEQSCDTYFYHLGLLVGPDELAKWARKFGLGERTGIALPGEAKGFIADVEWKKRKRGEEWYAGDTANMAVGQGFTHITPLQACGMVSVFANGGYLVKPRIFADEKEEKVYLGISPSTLELVKQGMERVVTGSRGTAKLAYIPGVTMAGKTGSAQDPPRKRTHAWFVCFAPVENPRVAVSVVVEEGGMGGSVAAPIAKKVVEVALKALSEERKLQN